VPRLLHPSAESGEAVMLAMDTLLRKKMREILHIHDPQQDGELDMCIKFGKVYCIDVSVGQTAMVREIYRPTSRREKSPSVNFSFNPTATPTSDIETVLGPQFKLKTQNEYVRMKVKVREPYHYWDVELDENFELRYLCPRDMRFASLTIVAADPTQVDVRVNVNSSRKFSVSEVPVDSELRKYMRGDWVLRDDRHGLVINTANPLYRRLTYASTRKERVYELERPRSLHSALEKRLQVRVQEATDYDEPRDGRFQKVTSRCELFMHVTTREAIEQVVDSADFVQSLFSLAARMSPQ
jgi:hypothetical protein